MLKMSRTARLIGMGSYLPQRVLDNYYFSSMVDTSHEWIFSRTGICERRQAAEGELASDMGVNAATQALEDAKVHPSEVDLILVATLTPDSPCPATACIIQRKLFMKDIPAFDLHAACSGFLYALSTAQAFILSGIYKTILVIATEKLSSVVDYQDRSTCILFGDGASACVVADRVGSNPKSSLKIGKISLGSSGDLAHVLHIPAGGGEWPASHESVERRGHFLQMQGSVVFKEAVRSMVKTTLHCLDQNNMTTKEINWLLPHQANIRIIQAVAERLQIPMELVCSNISSYGNTSAASLGILLDEFMKNQKLKVGDKLLLTTFGAGVTWGAGVLSYE